MTIAKFLFRIFKTVHEASCGKHDYRFNWVKVIAHLIPVSRGKDETRWHYSAAKVPWALRKASTRRAGAHGVAMALARHCYGATPVRLR